MKYVNLNGKVLKAEDAGLIYDNRAFRYGYGIFETMLFKDGIIQLKEYHWERLFAGMKQLNFEIPALFTSSWLEDQAIETVRKNNIGNLCRIRLQVYAGSGGLYDPGNPRPEFIIECFPIEEYAIQLNEAGLQVGIATDLAKSVDSIANLKSCNALLYVLAAQQAKANKWNDTLVNNTSGNIIESTIANLFFVKDKFIYTPPLQDGCVAGVMRKHIINTLTKHGIAVIEKSLNKTDLYNADELFLSNAIKRIKWVAGLENKVFEHNYTKYIYRLLFDTE